MRHSDINLTMSRYTHVFRGQDSDAVAALPSLDAAPVKQFAKATGTDGREALRLCHQQKKATVDDLMKYARICRVAAVMATLPGGDAVSKEAPTNAARSVHQRLLNEAKRTGRPFNETLQSFAMETLARSLELRKVDSGASIIRLISKDEDADRGLRRGDET